MTTDIFGNAVFTENQKEILKLADKELRVELSEEQGCTIDSITINVKWNRRCIHNDYSGVEFTIDLGQLIEVELKSNFMTITIDGDQAEKIYKRYLDLVGKYETKYKNPLIFQSLL